MKVWDRKGKIVPTSLMVMGVFLLAVAYVWRSEIGFNMVSPYRDMNMSISMHSVDNFYSKDSDMYTGEVVSKSSLVYRTDNVKDDHVEIQGMFDVRSLSGSKIASVEREYLVDIGDGTVSLDADTRAYLMAPGGKNKSDFKLRHFSGSDLVTMKFEKEEKINDLLTYKFVGSSKNDLSEEFSFLPEVPEKYGIENSFDISWWVEPHTGLLVKFSETGQNTFVGLENRTIVYPRNKYTNETTDESVLSLVQFAKLKSLNAIASTVVVPMFFLILGFTLILGTAFWFGFLGGYGGEDMRTGMIVKVVIYLVPITTLLATLFFVSILKTWNENQKFVEFGQQTEQIEESISRRFDIYLNALLGARGLFLASNDVNRDEWKTYVDALVVQSNFPGITHFGFNQWIDASDEAEFVETMTNEGYENYSMFPVGRSIGDARVLARFIEPSSDEIVEKIGFDLLSEENRRVALLSARDTTTPTTTGKTTLLVDLENNEPGVVMFLPVYKNGAATSTIEQRRESLIGYISGAVRIKDLMADLFGGSQSLGFDIYDTANNSDENLMFSSPITSNSAGSIYEQRKVMYALDRPWTIVYKTPSSTLQADNRILGLILVAGIGGSLLVFLTLSSLANSNSRARAIADLLTRDLKGANEKLALTLSGTGVGTWSVNEETRLIEMGAHSGRLLGFDGEITKTVDELITLFDDGEIDRLRLLFSGSPEVEEATVRISKLKDQKVRWVMFKGRPIYDEKGDTSKQEVGILTDVTNVKLAQLKLEKKTEELERINELMVGRELKMKELKDKLKKLEVK